MHISLEVTLRNGDKKVFPLCYRESDYMQAGSWHEFLIPDINHQDEVHLQMFTGDEYVWETVSYHFLEGLSSKGDVDVDDDEEDKGYKYAWQMLLDGKPATYTEVDQSLNCDFWLHIKSTRQTEGDWTSIPLDKTENGLDICDGIYEAVEVDVENGTEEDGTHYGKVLEAIEPILNRTTEYVKTTIDGITYTFTLSRCEEFYS